MYSQTRRAARVTSTDIIHSAREKSKKRKGDCVYSLQMEINLMDHKEEQSMSQKWRGNDGRRGEGKHEDAQRRRKTNSASLTRTGKHRMGMDVEDIHRQHACKVKQSTHPQKQNEYT